MGQSIDATPSIASKYSVLDNRIKIIIQNDSGIYEAMNTGIANADGKYLWFMNAGDKFAHQESMKEGLDQITNLNADLIIGGYSTLQSDDKVFVYKSKKLRLLPFLFNLHGGCHQAMVFKSDIFSVALKYDTYFPLSADFKLASLIIGRKNSFRVSKYLAIIEKGGISDQNIIEVHKEKHTIRKSLIPLIGTFSLMYFFVMKIYFILKNSISGLFR